MRLRVHIATANEELVALVNEGYDALSAVQDDYRRRKEQGTYDDSNDVDELVAPVNTWADKVVESLGRIFPTQLETHLFLDPEIPFGAVSGDYNYQSTLKRCHYYVRGLNRIRLQSLPEYTDLPLDARLYVEDIDSFRRVRDVNPATVMAVLTNGYSLDLLSRAASWSARTATSSRSLAACGRHLQRLVRKTEPVSSWRRRFGQPPTTRSCSSAWST
jgi:hypothetical protein